MIVNITRGHIKIEINNRVAIVQGEMFFPEDNKLGFVVYSDTIRFWEKPHESIPISNTEKQLILNDIAADFSKEGHTLEIE